VQLHKNQRIEADEFYHTAAPSRSSSPSEDDPHIGALGPPAATVVAQDGLDVEPGAFQPSRHLSDRQRPERQRELMLGRLPAPALDVTLIESRQPPARILPHRLDQGEMRAAGRATAKLDPILVLAPVRNIRHEIDPEQAAGRENPADRLECRCEIAFGEQRLQNPVRRQNHGKMTACEWQRTNVAANETKSCGELGAS
jgi:hypothetical protein